MTTVEERLEAVLREPLSSIVDDDVRMSPEPEVVRHWDLSKDDMAALLTWGLPADQILTPDFQREPTPEVVPNVAGPIERQVIAPGERLYRLGWWGSGGREPMIATGLDGRVLATRAKPFTVADVHPQLRPDHQDLYHPSVQLINSSIASFVEITWRWRAAIPVLLSLTEPLAAHDVAAYFDRVHALERAILVRIEEIDDAVRVEDTDSLWQQLVTDEGC